jgi:hypothetical protein
MRESEYPGVEINEHLFKATNIDYHIQIKGVAIQYEHNNNRILQKIIKNILIIASTK